jgi:hypothetical protein
MKSIAPYPLPISHAARTVGSDRSWIRQAITRGELPLRVFIGKQKRIAPDNCLKLVNNASGIPPTAFSTPGGRFRLCDKRLASIRGGREGGGAQSFTGIRHFRQSPAIHDFSASANVCPLPLEGHPDVPFGGSANQKPEVEPCSGRKRVAVLS